MDAMKKGTGERRTQGRTGALLFPLPTRFWEGKIVPRKELLNKVPLHVVETELRKLGVTINIVRIPTQVRTAVREWAFKGPLALLIQHMVDAAATIGVHALHTHRRLHEHLITQRTREEATDGPLRAMQGLRDPNHVRIMVR